MKLDAVDAIIVLSLFWLFASGQNLHFHGLVAENEEKWGLKPPQSNIVQVEDGLGNKKYFNIIV